jgi:hypothetical protein
MFELEALLQVIEAIERDNAGKSPYEIANILRGYTKAAYTTPAWTAATGYKQPWIEGKLNHEVRLSGELTDFGHLIAALADQINQPGFRFSDLTSWTADHTVWAGDIGSAIALFRAQSGGSTIKTIDDALSRLARDSDYAADVAACVLGNSLNLGGTESISQLIRRYHTRPYTEHVRLFLVNRFGVSIVNDQLQNPEKVEAEIRKSVFTYLELSPESGILKTIRSLLDLKPKLDVNFKRFSLSTDLLQGSLHFLAHLVTKGNLQPLKFHPYQLPQAPWIGSVSYEVTVPDRSIQR